jgi:4-hydroxybenzoate polyprenyltransferase
MGLNLKAYADLTRVHFFFVWPLLFCSGLFLALQYYGGFSPWLVLQAVLIGFLGFEAGLVLNDIVDHDVDKRDVEFDKLTKYWRPFGQRPISQGMIPQQNALAVFGVLVAATSLLIFTLPFPQAFYVWGIMLGCYSLEIFYQLKKRNERFPIAQLIGRVDFTLFPIAGYLCIGGLDVNALLFGLFFYPLAMAHLGVNDLADVVNDEARQLNTIPTLYGMKKTTYWILFFSVAHFVAATVFSTVVGTWAIAGFAPGFLLIGVGNVTILRGKNAVSGMKALPMFHLALLVYTITIIASYFL